MSDRTIRRFVEGLLRGQRTEHARPDDFEAEQMKTAGYVAVAKAKPGCLKGFSSPIGVGRNGP